MSVHGIKTGWSIPTQQTKNLLSGYMFTAICDAHSNMVSTLVCVGAVVSSHVVPCITIYECALQYVAYGSLAS